jgi:hypothetical protein
MAETSKPGNERLADQSHYADSSARENLIEHVFLGELLRGLWRKNVRDLEVFAARGRQRRVRSGAGIQGGDPSRAAEVELHGGTAVGHHGTCQTAGSTLGLHPLDIFQSGYPGPRTISLVRRSGGIPKSKCRGR